MPLAHRTTRQKEAIKAALTDQNHPLLPDEIHRMALKSVPSLGIATVYRCRSCQRVFDFQKCVEGLKKLAPPGFRVMDHEIILYGHCRNCTG